MSPSRSRVLTPRISKPWAAAATAVVTLAIVGTPLGGGVPRCAEAFVAPSLVPSAYSAATNMYLSPPRPADFACGDRSAERPTYAAAGALGGGWRSRVRFAPVGGGRCGLGALRSSVPDNEGVGGLGGMREGDGLPEKNIPVVPVEGVTRKTMAEEEEEEDNDGSWSDAEVARRVEERKESKDDPYADAEEEGEEDADAERYEEIIANMTKPLGITIEASTDQAELIYVTSVGQQAEDAGLEVGDVLTGVSAVFGNDVWSVKGKTIEKVRSLVRCRTEPFILVRVERGHVSLEERCAEGFGLVEDADCWRLTEDGECEVEYTNLWAKVYKEEMDVISGGAAAAGGSGRGETKRTNEPPPPRDSPGMGSFSGESWGAGDF